MFDFKIAKSKWEEYAPGHYNIICTEEEFVNNIDHTQLNKYHFFIEIMRPLNTMLMFALSREIQACLIWANSISEAASSLPIRKIDFENNAVYIDKQFKDIINTKFKKAKYWQIEIQRLNIFVITAPKKPKILYIN